MDKLEDTNYHNISLLATLECIASNPIKASKLARNSNFQVYFHLLVGRRVPAVCRVKHISNYIHGSSVENKIFPSSIFRCSDHTKR